MIIHLAMDPLPYSPLSIVDTSPFHSSLAAHDASKPRARRWAPRVAAARVVAGLALLTGNGSFAARTAGGTDASSGFGLAAGNAVPIALAPSAAGDVRLAPGNATAPVLER